MEDDIDDDAAGAAPGDSALDAPSSLLPYDQWSEEALRQVVVRALSHAASEGMPGEHHFYITFRTDYPGVAIPPRLRARYPSEMTIVLQHQFWDLKVESSSMLFSVGLSFGGVASTLRIPLAAMTAFADPFVQFGLRFRVEAPPVPVGLLPHPAPKAVPDAVPDDTPPEAAEEPQVVSLDAFRRRTPPKND